MSAHRSAVHGGKIQLLHMHPGVSSIFSISQSLYMPIPSNYILSSAFRSREVDKTSAEPEREAHAEIIGILAVEASEPLRFVLLLVDRNDDAIFRQNFLHWGRSPASSSKKDAGVGSSDFPRSKSDVGVSDGLVGLVERSLSVLLALVLEQ